MIGLVVVSHSAALARAALALAGEMVPPERRPAVALAAGLADEAVGTDAAAVAEAIESVDSPDGVLVLCDLGSALLSADLALELIPPEVAARVRLSAAPLVEGLVAALVTAATGASLTEVDREACESLSGKVDHLGMPDAGPEPDILPTDGETVVRSWTLRNPHGLHARPAAALVTALARYDARTTVRNVTTGAGPVPGTSVTKVATLGLAHGHVLELTATGADAEQVMATVGELVARQFGEVEAPPAAPPAVGGTGRQVVIGPAWVPGVEPDESSYVPGDDEVGRFHAAAAQVRARLQSPSSGFSDVFEAQAALLSDPSLASSVEQHVAEGASGLDAVRRAFATVADEFEQLDDPYLRARAEDIRSLSRQVRAALVGEQALADVPERPSVLVVAELDAATAATLDTDWCLGVVTFAGGTTGHGVLVASSRGIPVLAARPEAARVRTGDMVGMDPVTGDLMLEPDEDAQTQLRARAAERQEHEKEASTRAHDPAVTQTGVRIAVEANVSSLDDALRAAQEGADGVGLVRTELLFGERGTPPSTEEQVQVFRALAAAMAGRAVTVRTWDVGGDKPLAYLPAPRETNPFLGERGLRLMRRWPDLFDDQVAAVLRAGAEAPMRLMFPMVTRVEELRWARERLEAVRRKEGLGEVPVGIMVEVPAAAIGAAQFAGLVDFVSFGTNDLGQYTYAVDRGNAQVANLLSPDAVLELIAMTVRQLPGVTFGVCGDLASDPLLVPRLVELGVGELSVRPPLVPTVKQAVRSSS